MTSNPPDYQKKYIQKWSQTEKGKQITKESVKKYHQSEKGKIAQKKSVKNHRAKRTDLINDYKKNGCVLCHEKTLVCLDLHHLNPEEKKFSISSQKHTHTQEKFIEELNKCIVLCANCHRKLHYGLITLEMANEIKYA